MALGYMGGGPSGEGPSAGLGAGSEGEGGGMGAMSSPSACAAAGSSTSPSTTCMTAMPPASTSGWATAAVSRLRSATVELLTETVTEVDGLYRAGSEGGRRGREAGGQVANSVEQTAG